MDATITPPKLRFDPERLRFLRLSRGLSGERLAREIGVSYTTVFKWEHGIRIPKLDNLLKIAEVLEVRHTALLTER